MSEFMFCPTQKRYGARVARRLDEICKAEGGHGFTSYSAPGAISRGWFTGRNYGEPFNSALAKRVMAAVEAAGIDYS
jgi:hypothetical protein